MFPDGAEIPMDREMRGEWRFKLVFGRYIIQGITKLLHILIHFLKENHAQFLLEQIGKH